nr:acetyl-CoA carboxylase biotin carboxyl carrier protein subunit [candidate division Zixibacteria bacterium]
MINEFQYQDDLIETNAELGENGVKVSVGDKIYFITEKSPGLYCVIINGHKVDVCCIIRDGKAYLDIEARLLDLKIPSEDGATASGAAGGVGVKDKIFAPMPGKIVKIQVGEGEEVKEKQPMVIVEAMKMENQLISPAAGRVKKINFSEGDQVDTETPIIELELPEEE